MKKATNTLVFILLCSIYCSAFNFEEDYSYQPYLKDGRLWVYHYFTVNNRVNIKRKNIYTERLGDVVYSSGKEYRRLIHELVEKAEFPEDPDFVFEEQYRHNDIIREEDKQVFKKPNANSDYEPTLYLDFSLRLGDVLDKSRYFPQYDFLYVERYKVVAEEIIQIKNRLYRKIYVHIDEGDGYRPHANFIEGIGNSFGYEFSPVEQEPTCINEIDYSTPLLDAVYDDGELIFEWSDFSLTDNVVWRAGISGLPNESPLHERYFDLNGIEYDTRPSFGMYVIRYANGSSKKCIAR